MVHDELGGELEVTGKGEIEIHLPQFFSWAIVYFIDSECNITCSPQTHDVLGWRLHHGWEERLFISFDVAGSRNILWKVK